MLPEHSIRQTSIGANSVGPSNIPHMNVHIDISNVLYYLSFHRNTNLWVLKEDPKWFSFKVIFVEGPRTLKI